MSASTTRQKRYRERMNDAGYREIMLWVHDDDREALKEFAKQLREERDQDQAA